MADSRYPFYKLVGLVGGPALFLVTLVFFRPNGMDPEMQSAAIGSAAVGALMVTWWITEAIPLAATSLAPLALFPILGVMTAKSVGATYGDANIFLFLGGFFIAMAMQKWNLHARVALNIIARIGTNPHRVALGVMVATAFLSMWISNTATTMMMLPIGMAIIDEFKGVGSKKAEHNFSIAVLLGIAYSASIGGIGTLIGTPTNAVLASQYSILYPEEPEIDFLHWMLVGIPIVIVFIPVAWVLLTRVIFRLDKFHPGAQTAEIDQRLEQLGPMSRGEKIVLAVSCLTALAWMTRKLGFQIGNIIIHGWSTFFPHSDYIHDGTVAVFFALVLFAIPVNLKKGEFALDWEWAKRIPWGILILFGGGLALADGFKTTGLVKELGQHLTILSGLHPVVIVLCVAGLMTFLTEITSNVATTSMMLPILASAATEVLGINPLLLMVPATISASLAFMLPVATPPNAIVFGGNHITIPEMARAGLVLNLIGILLVTLLTFFVGVAVFDIDLGQWPR